MKISTMKSIENHAKKFPQPHNKIIRDIAERFDITCGEVWRRMEEQRKKYSV